jgi:exosortase/archaeosortase family protein
MTAIAAPALDTSAEPRPASTVLHHRAALLVASLAVVYWPALRYTFHSLLSFDPNSPLVFVPFVPLAALAVASTRWQGAIAEPGPLPDRGADVIIGGFFIIGAWLAAYEAPRIFSTETLAWRADLLSLAPFVAGMIALLFGGRMLFRLRGPLLLLTAMSPGLYRPLLAPLRTGLDAATFAMVGVLHYILGWFDTASTTLGQYVTIHGKQSFTVSVTQACAGGGAVVAGLLLAGTVCLVTTGTLRRKLAWSAATVALCWTGNLLRLIVLFGVGYRYGMPAMMGSLHDWLGALFLMTSLSIALLLPGVMGLTFLARTPHPTPTHCLSPLGFGSSLLALVAVVAVAIPSGQATTRFDFLAGNSRLAEPSARAAVRALPGVAELTPVVWAPAYFGANARWDRWLVFPADAPDGTLPTAVDVVLSTDASRFDTYGLAACYGFHGYRLTLQGTTSLPGGRIGESIVYRDDATGAHVTVLAWRQKMAGGGFERIVVQRRSARPTWADLAAVRAVATNILSQVDGQP